MSEFNPFGDCQQLADARDRVASMDKIDGCTQAAYPIADGLRTVLSALAVKGPSKDDAYWDAIVMLQQIEEKQRNEVAI